METIFISVWLLSINKIYSTRFTLLAFNNYHSIKDRLLVLSAAPTVALTRSMFPLLSTCLEKLLSLAVYLCQSAVPSTATIGYSIQEKN